MSSHYELFYAECFGNDIEQKRFYREEFPKTLRTYSLVVEPDGRIRIAVNLPPESIPSPTSDMRESLKSVAKMPYAHRGGRLRHFPEDEIPDLWQKVRSEMRQGSTRSQAIRKIANSEGAKDPRTLKMELVRAGYILGT